MGGFQGVAAGLGEAGEQLGTGIDNANKFGLQLRQQSHLENVDAQKIALAQALQKQEYDIANQQHELMRQQILQNGWAHVGTVKEGNQYFQVFQNPRMPQGQQNMKLPYNGVPPDSPESMISSYQTFRTMKDENDHPLFTDTQAKQVAFKMANLYREGPAGIVQTFRELAEEQAAAGVKSIKIPGLGEFPITTPKGVFDYAQAALSTIHPGGLYRALSAAANKDTTGWTAGEKREYDALRIPAERQAAVIAHMADVQMANTTAAFDPEQQRVIKQQMLEQVDAIMKPVEERAAEISNRHHAAIPFQVPVGAPSPAGKPDGFELVNKQNQVIARVKGGRYVAP